MEQENDKKYITLFEAAKNTPHSSEYLSLRARQGKLKAIKFGRNWVTTKEWLSEYLKHAEVSKQERVRKLVEFNKNGDIGKTKGKIEKRISDIPISIPEKPIIFISLRTISLSFFITLLFVLNLAFVFGKFPELADFKQAIASNLKNAVADITQGPREIVRLVSEINKEVNLSVIDIKKSSEKEFKQGILEEQENLRFEGLEKIENTIKDVGISLNEQKEKIVKNIFDSQKAQIEKEIAEKNYFTNFSQNIFKNLREGQNELSASLGDKILTLKNSDPKEIISYLKRIENELERKTYSDFKKDIAGLRDFVIAVKNNLNSFGNLVQKAKNKIASSFSFIKQIKFPELQFPQFAFSKKEFVARENYNQDINEIRNFIMELESREVPKQEIVKEVARMPTKEVVQTKEIIKLDEEARSKMEGQISFLEQAVSKLQSKSLQAVYTPSVPQLVYNMPAVNIGTGNSVLEAERKLSLTAQQIELTSAGSLYVSGPISQTVSNSTTAMSVTQNGDGKILDLYSSNTSSTAELVKIRGTSTAATLAVYQSGTGLAINSSGSVNISEASVGLSSKVADDLLFTTYFNEESLVGSRKQLPTYTDATDNIPTFQVVSDTSGLAPGGRGLYFSSGTDSEVLTYSGSGNIDADDGTIVIWYKPNYSAAAASSNKYIFESPSHLRIFFNSTDKKFYFQAYNGTNWTTASIISSEQSFSSGDWISIIGSFDDDAGILNLYINNTKTYDSDTWTAQSVPAAFYLGSDSSNTNQADGLISDFTIFNRVLTQQETQQIYYLREPISDYAHTTTKYSRTLVVSKWGGDYTSIGAALTAFGTSYCTANFPCAIFVMPGIYEESITMKEYVDIIGSGKDSTTIKQSTATVVTTASNAKLENFKIYKTTDNSTPIITVAASSPTLKNLSILGAGKITQEGISITSGSPSINNIETNQTNIAIKNATGSPYIYDATINNSAYGINHSGTSGTTTIANSKISTDTTDIFSSGSAGSIISSGNILQSTSKNFEVETGAIIESSNDNYLLVDNDGTFRDISNTKQYTCTATEQVGNVVYSSAANTVAQAKADSNSTMPAIGIVIKKPTTTTCLVKTGGVYYENGAGWTSGNYYYVSSTTAGAITGTEPVGKNIQIIGVAKSSEEMNLYFITTGSSSYQNTITVSPDGGNFTTIQSAIDAITNSSSSNRYLVLVYPGVYSEAITVNNKSYIDIVGISGPEATKITQTATAVLTISGNSGNFRIQGLNFDVSADTRTGGSVIDLSGTGTGISIKDNKITWLVGTGSGGIGVSISSTATATFNDIEITGAITGFKQTGNTTTAISRCNLTAGASGIDIDLNSGTINSSFNLLKGPTNFDIALGATLNSYKDNYNKVVNLGTFNQLDYSRNDSEVALYVNQAGSGNAFTVAGAGNITFSTTGTITQSGTGDVTWAGATTFQGNVVFGNATSDTVSYTARVASNILPSTDNTYDLGENSTPLRWRAGYFGTSIIASTTTINSTGISTQGQLTSSYIPTSTTDKTFYAKPAQTNPSQKYLFDGGSSYTDVYTMMGDNNDKKYFGYSTKFTGVYLSFTTVGAGYTNTFEYSKGSDVWGSVTVTDNTSNFIQNGRIYFSPPSDWTTDTVNGQGPYYWIRIATSTNPTTTAISSANYILPAGYSFATYLSSEDTTPMFYVDYKGNVQVTTLLIAQDLSVSGNVQSNLIPTSPTKTYDLGSAALYWKTAYIDTVTASNIIGTIVGGSTSSQTWTIDSANAGVDRDMSLIFNRGSNAPNATFGWDSTLHQFTLNAPLVMSSEIGTTTLTLPGTINTTGGAIQTNSTTRIDNAGNLSNIGTFSSSVTPAGATAVDLISGTLTNNTASGTQRGLVLTLAGSGVTENGAIITYSGGGTGNTAFEISGTWTNGILTNNNSINAGSGAIQTTGAISGNTVSSTSTLTASNGFTMTTGALSLTATSGSISATGLGVSTIGTTSADFTLSTTTSGTLTLSSAAALTVSYSGGNIITTGSDAITLGNSGDTLALSSSGWSIDATGNIALGTGAALRTGTTAGNTLLLQAYDNDTGPGYITFGTLTAGNTPSFELDGTTLDTAVAKGTWTASGTWTIPAVTLSGAVSGGDQSFTNVGDMTFAAGSILASGGTNGNTLLINANDTTFITLTTGATDTLDIGAHNISGNVTVTSGVSIASGSTNGNTLTINANDTPFITLATGATDTMTLGSFITTDASAIEIGAAGVIKSGATNGDTLLIASNDTTFLTFTTGATDTLDIGTTATIGSAYIYRVGGTDVAVSDGGTGLSSIAAFGTYYASATDTLAVLTPNTTTTKKFLSMTGTGAAGQAPTWDQPKLDAFAATTSAELITVISDETGSGKLVFDTAPVFPTKITIGAAGGTTGSLDILGTTSGTVTLKVADAAGTYTLTLPTSNGDADQFLQTNGEGVLTWAAAGNPASISQLNTNVTVTDAGDGYITFTEDGTEYMRITGGNVGIGTTAPDRALEINSATGINLRLTYNDSNGSATYYTDLLTTSAGALTITPSGNIMNIGGGTTATEIRFLEPSGSGTNYTAFKVAAQTADITYTLPTAVGAAGTVLTDAAGNGVLSWAAGGSSNSITQLNTDVTVTDAGDGYITFTEDGTEYMRITGGNVKIAEASNFIFGDFNAFVFDDMEATADWTEEDPGNTPAVDETGAANVKVGTGSMKITTTGSSNDDYIRKDWGSQVDWSGYERVGFWIKSNVTGQTISIQFSEAAGGPYQDHNITISSANDWQYEEWDISSIATANKNEVEFVQFVINNDTGSPTFYIDQLRIYDSDERSSEMFVDKAGYFTLVGKAGLEITGTTPGATEPSIRIDSAVVTLHQPLEVDVAGDVGIDYDLYFANTGLAQITSEGPLKVSGGDANGAENLTLTVAGSGDVIVDVSGNASNDFRVVTTGGADALLITQAGKVGIGTSSIDSNSWMTIINPSYATLPASSATVLAMGSSDGTTTGVSIRARGTVTGGLADIGEYVKVQGGTADYEAGDILEFSSTITGECDFGQKFENKDGFGETAIGDLEIKNKCFNVGVFKKSSTPYSSKIAGAVSYTAGLIAGGGATDIRWDPITGRSTTHAILALAGQIPVKVSCENGSIGIGDAITSSSLLGIGMRADKSGRIVGYSLEEFACPSNSQDADLSDIGSPTNLEENIGKVTILVNPGWLGNDMSVEKDADGKIKEKGLAKRLKDLGLVVNKEGILEVSELKAKKITLYDSQTDAPYCLFIENGQLKTTSGECDSTPAPTQGGTITSGAQAAVGENNSSENSENSGQETVNAENNNSQGQNTENSNSNSEESAVENVEENGTENSTENPAEETATNNETENSGTNEPNEPNEVIGQ